MPPEGFEPAIPASDRLQTHASDPADTGIGLIEDNYDKQRAKQQIFAVKGVKEPGDVENGIYHPRFARVSLSPGKHGAYYMYHLLCHS